MLIGMLAEQKDIDAGQLWATLHNGRAMIHRAAENGHFTETKWEPIANNWGSPIYAFMIRPPLTARRFQDCRKKRHLQTNTREIATFSAISEKSVLLNNRCGNCCGLFSGSVWHATDWSNRFCDFLAEILQGRWEKWTIFCR